MHKLVKFQFVSSNNQPVSPSASFDVILLYRNIYHQYKETGEVCKGKGKM
jgi:hypothetical protein